MDALANAKENVADATNYGMKFRRVKFFLLTPPGKAKIVGQFQEFGIDL